jgi:secondary thiamine-phosphate synthase enzyme
MWQKEITLKPRPRGHHLITSEISSALNDVPIEDGILHLFIKHTSAALTINENADPSVRDDFDSSMDNLVKENESYYTHTAEGPDDMPAHIKSSLMGSSVTIPITKGKMNMGTWQGVYLCEYRDHGGARKLVASFTF